MGRHVLLGDVGEWPFAKTRFGIEPVVEIESPFFDYLLKGGRPLASPDPLVLGIR